MNLITPEVRSQMEEMTPWHIWRYLDGDAKKERIEALEAQMSEGSFWDDQSAAQTVITEVNR